MKTHELATALRDLASILERSPSVELDKFDAAPAPKKGAKIGIGLSLLLELSKITKSEWIDFLKEHDLPLRFDARDSSRNILGKLLNYLENTPEAATKLKTRGLASTETSPTLTRALRALMEE